MLGRALRCVTRDYSLVFRGQYFSRRYMSDSVSLDGPFHPGEVEIQKRANTYHAAQETGEIVNDFIPPDVGAFLRSRIELYTSTLDKKGNVWAGVVYGRPGFARVTDMYVPFNGESLMF